MTRLGTHGASLSKVSDVISAEKTPRKNSGFLVIGIILFCMYAGMGDGHAQKPPRLSSPLSLADAIQYALDHYPAVRESLAKLSAAQSGIELAQTAYLPKVEMGIQANHATFNNVSGLVFPMSVIQPISGPDLGRRSYSGSWGSAAGILLAWEPFDFGLRSANVESARAAERHSQAQIALTQLEVGVAVGDAYLRLAMAEEAVKALEANVARRQVFRDTVKVLVDNQLRPGVDLSRAQAELAGARIQLIESEQLRDVGLATLGQVLGLAGEPILIEDKALRGRTVVTLADDQDPTRHPLAVLQQAAITLPQTREAALGQAWVPKFSLQSALYSRGTGWDAQGNRTVGSDGLLPDVPNWAVGLTATFSLLDFASLRAQERKEHYQSEAETARYNLVIQELISQNLRAKASFNSAKRIAEQTPLQLHAAQETETQAQAQFKAGLATVVEVAEAQRLVVQASIDDVKARLGVWHALLGLAGNQGDLQPFLNILKGEAGDNNLPRR